MIQRGEGGGGVGRSKEMLSSMGCRKPASQQAVCLQAGETHGGKKREGEGGEACSGSS